MPELIKTHKVVAALPGALEANSVYYVRVGGGVDMYVTNDMGLVTAYALNAPTPTPESLGLDPVEVGSTITYSDGAISRIDYPSGNYKVFTYTALAVTQLDYVIGSVTHRKTFTYNPNGTLASVTKSEL